MNKTIINNLNDLAMNIYGFDEAVEIPVGFNIGGSFKNAEKYKGIFNNSQERLASIVSKKYKVIQHRDVLSAVTQTLGKLKLDVSGIVKTFNETMQADLVFKDEGLRLKDDATGIMLGFRVLNSYDKTSSFRLEAYAYRIVCNNGMAFGNVLETRSVTFHTGQQKTFETIEAITEKFIVAMINNQEKLQLLINKSFEESIAWENVEPILEKLLTIEKHKKAIMAKLTIGQELTRWNLYNALTDYLSHDETLKQGVISHLERVSQRIIEKPLTPLLEVE